MYKKNKRWKREAKRIYGECCKVTNGVIISDCNSCKYVKVCFSPRLNWCGKYGGIRELEKKYTESINNADSVKVQQQLKKAMDQQLENLKQKDKLTQYDLDRANKLYEIQLAQIALEEA